MDPNIERRMQRERLETQLEKLTIAQRWLAESSKKDDEDGPSDDYDMIDSLSAATGDMDDVDAEEDKTMVFA